MAERSYRWLLIALALIGLSLDQVSKYGVFRWLYNDGLGDSREVVEGYFRLIAQFDPAIQPSTSFGSLQTWSGSILPRVNHGALFGLGGSQKGTANGFFTIVSFVAAAAILIWGTRRGPAREKWLSISLGLILGGTIGNLYDRIVFGGVRDFLYFYYIEWPVSNIADCCLVCGAALLLIQAVSIPPPVPAQESANLEENAAVAVGPTA